VITTGSRSPGRASARASRRLVAAGVVLTALFAIGGALVPWPPLAAVDRSVLESVARTRPTDSVDALNWAFRIGYAPLGVVVSIVLAAVVVYRTRRLGLALIPLLLLGAMFVQSLSRLVVERPGPGVFFALPRAYEEAGAIAGLDRTDAAARGAFVQVTGAGDENDQGRGSYPSGHAVRLAFFAGLGVLATRTRYGVKATSLVGLVLGAIAVAVGYSALYFGYHWPSDILGGYLLGAGVATVCWGVLHR
jgi:membrane-associated phospholipid phosphatase